MHREFNYIHQLYLYHHQSHRPSRWMNQFLYSTMSSTQSLHSSLTAVCDPVQAVWFHNNRRSVSQSPSPVLVCLSTILPTLLSSRTTVFIISTSDIQYATLHSFERAPSMQQCNHAIITLTLLSYFIPASSQYHHVLICPFHPASELSHLGKDSLSVS